MTVPQRTEPAENRYTGSEVRRLWPEHADDHNALADVVSGSAGLVLTGTGTPEGAVVAEPGTLYLDDAGGASVTLYVKEANSTNLGWVAK